MKILFIAGQEITIMPNHRVHHFISFLERLGTQVDVISLMPFYTGPRPASPWTRFMCGIRDSISNPVEVLQMEAGVQVCIRKLPDRIDAFAQALWAYLHLGPLARERYELCIFGNPDNVLLPLLLRKRGLVETIIYDDWDLYPGFDRSWFWKRLTRYREHLCVSLADVVISVGSLLKELRKSQGATRTLVIPNGVNYQLFAKAQQKRPHPPTLIYIGRLAESWGVDVSIEGFANVCSQMPEARYLIIGYNEGPYVEYLQDMVDQLQLNDRVLFLGPKRYEELPYYLAEADIGVALHKPNELMRYAFPLKVVEYMAAGLAVVGIGVGETEKLILESGSGSCVGYSSETFASAVLDMLSDRAVLTGYCEHAKEYAKLFDWNSLFFSLLNEIKIAPPRNPYEGQRGQL